MLRRCDCARAAGAAAPTGSARTLRSLVGYRNGGGYRSARQREVRQIRVRRARRSPTTAVYDLIKRAAVQPIDDGQRPVCRVADRKHVRKEPSLRQTQDGPGLPLIGGRRVTGSNPQVSRRNRHRVCRLAKVKLQQSRLPVVLR